MSIINLRIRKWSGEAAASGTEDGYRPDEVGDDHQADGLIAEKHSRSGGKLSLRTFVETRWRPADRPVALGKVAIEPTLKEQSAEPPETEPLLET